jgi:hypothetical protein
MRDELNDVVEDIKAAGLDVTDEGDIEDFLGVNIEKIDDDIPSVTAPPDRSNHSDLHLDQDSRSLKEHACIVNVINAHTNRNRSTNTSTTEV